MGLEVIIRNLNKLILLSILTLILIPAAHVYITPLTSAQNTRTDLEPDLARIYGWVQDINTGQPAVNYTVKIAGETYRGNSTVTDEFGYYDIYIISGDHTLTISKNQVIYEYRKINRSSVF